MTRVDVVIPTFNGRDHLRACLSALQDQTFTDFNAIVVDDGSTDSTEQMVLQDFPDVDYLRLTGNSGFAAACNHGIAHGSSEFVALLNNDAIPELDWLQQLVEGMGRHPAAASAASKILLADGSGRIHTAGDTFSVTGLPGNRGVWEIDHGQYDREEEVFAACAAAALYRRSTLLEAERITGSVFEPDFFMYCEDIDLGWRLRLLGYSTVYVPDARVLHHLSATGGGPLASYYVARNQFALLTRNLPSEIQRSVWQRFLIHQGRQLTEALRHIGEPAARARIRGILDGPAFARTQRRKRWMIQTTRRASSHDIERLLTR